MLGFPKETLTDAGRGYVIPLGLLGLILASVGSMLPWAIVRPAGGVLTIGTVHFLGTDSGVDSSSGWIVLSVAAISFVVLTWYWLGGGARSGRAALLIMLGVLIVLVAVTNIADINQSANDLEASLPTQLRDEVSLDVGAGLYLIVVGGICLVAASMMGRLIGGRQSRTLSTERPPETPSPG